MRTADEILADVCSAFNIDTELYFSFVNGKRPPDHISLVTMGFVYIMTNSSCMNMTDIAKVLKKTPAAISTAYSKTTRLLKTNTRYAKAFRATLIRSCDEGRDVFINQTV